MKFKVGDKVKVRIDLMPHEVYGGLTFFNGNMSKCTGQICTIKEITENNRYPVKENIFVWSEEMLEPVAPTLAEIKNRKLTCVIHTKTKNEAKMLIELLGVNKNYIYDSTDDCINAWELNKENTCYQIIDGKARRVSHYLFYADKGETIYDFPDLFATGGVVSIHDLPISEWYNSTRLTFKNGSSIKALPNTSDTIISVSDFLHWF